MSVKGAAVKRLFFIGQQTTDNRQQTLDMRCQSHS